MDIILYDRDFPKKNLYNMTLGTAVLNLKMKR